MKVAYIPYYSNEMNDVAFSKKFDYRWSNFLKRKLEENGHEIHTYDILPFEEADAILSFDNVYFQNMKLFNRIMACNKLGCVTHIDYEPPSANCRIHDDAGLRTLSKMFKNLITYNDNVIGDNIIKGCIGDFFTEEREYLHDFKERKLVTILANYRVSLMLFGQHPYELYSERGRAVKYFQDKCPKDFDLYGNFWTDDLKKCYVRPVARDEKLNVISKYKFLVSYDSLCNQNGYISEKIFDCFNAKTVPIYYGADNVTDYIPKGCFIDKRDFKSYDELYDYLVNMDEETYEEYIRNIEEFLKSDNYSNLFSSEASANILYDALMKPKVNRNTKEVKDILSKFEELRKSDIKYNYANNFYDYHVPNLVEINSYDILKKGFDVDYNLKFKFYSSYDKELSVYYKVNGKNKYNKLEVSKEKLEGVYNGASYTFYLSIFDIISYSKLALFVKYNNSYYPLNIETLIPFDSFTNYFKLYIAYNYFYVKKSFKDKILSLYHNNRLIRVIYKLIRFPFKLIKILLEVFYK